MQASKLCIVIDVEDLPLAAQERLVSLESPTLTLDIYRYTDSKIELWTSVVNVGLHFVMF